MRHASIMAFLNAATSPEEFAAEIAAEVASCNQAVRSGGIGHIIVSDGPETVITRDHAKQMLASVLGGRMSFEFANYIADGLMMSEDFYFADKAVAQAINFIEDDSRPPTDEEIRAALAALL